MLLLGFEKYDGIGAEVAEPDVVLLVDIDRVCVRPRARQAPRAPSRRLWVITLTWPAIHSLTQIRPEEFDYTRRAPCFGVGGSMTSAQPVVSIRAMWLPAKDA